MRLIFLSLLFACGGSQGQRDANGQPRDGRLSDGPKGGDAPVESPLADCTPTSGTLVALVPLASGLAEPLGVAAPVGDTRLFAIEQGGRIRLVKDGLLAPEPVLDLGSIVLVGGERGLLGLAFHPQFAQTRTFYVNYTRAPDGATTIAEYTLPNGADVAAPTSRTVLVIPQPFSNHNAGWLEFGADGYLYIAMGDGGSGGDPDDVAQDDASWLGKVLRIDVDTRTGQKGYGIPSDNPFAASMDGVTDPRPENWHKGLRNPFRFALDGDSIWLGDVGQGDWEEIDMAANVASINWGWDDREGAHCFEPANGCLTVGRTDPLVEHASGDGFHSIIGGRVYRGGCFPDLAGTYFYADYAQGGLWGLRVTGGNVTEQSERIPNVGTITGIHQDGFGELVISVHDGRLLRVVAE